jgi:hypothetical protein
MATEKLDLDVELAKIEAEVTSARDKADALEKSSETRKKELLAKLREPDLETVRALCERHGFTATDLRGALKTKGAKKSTPRKSTARKTTARKTSTRKKPA